MSEQIFRSIVNRPRTEVSRRGPLMTIGLALAAAAASRSTLAAAGKDGKHGRKKRKSKSGRSCQAQVADCQEFVTIACSSSEYAEACRERALPCCDPLAECRAFSMLECYFDS